MTRINAQFNNYKNNNKLCVGTSSVIYIACECISPQTNLDSITWNAEVIKKIPATLFCDAVLAKCLTVLFRHYQFECLKHDFVYIMQSIIRTPTSVFTYTKYTESTFTCAYKILAIYSCHSFVLFCAPYNLLCLLNK